MKGMITAGLVMILVVLVGCAQPQQPVENVQPSVPATPSAPAVGEPQVPVITDCNNSADCFLPHVRECTPAKAKYVGQTTTRIYEIKGVKDQYSCNVHLITISANVVDEDCVAATNQELYGGQGYYKNERDMAYFQVTDCTNREVL